MKVTLPIVQLEFQLRRHEPVVRLQVEPYTLTCLFQKHLYKFGRDSRALKLRRRKHWTVQCVRLQLFVVSPGSALNNVAALISMGQS